MKLATVLRLNALSCLAFGALFIALPDAVSSFLGDAPPTLLRVLGIVLVVNGAHLGWASARRPDGWEVRYFSIGDALWVLATLALLVSGIWVTTDAGKAAALVVAGGVGCLGWLQWRAVATTRHA